MTDPVTSISLQSLENKNIAEKEVAVKIVLG